LQKSKSNKKGRQPLVDDERRIVVSIRLKPRHRDKLKLLGAEWLRAQIENAKLS
jgi:hypothetical protein